MIVNVLAGGSSARLYPIIKGVSMQLLPIYDKPKLGYEYQLLWMSQNVSPVYVYNASDVKWYEIDDENDLKYAENQIVSVLNK